MRSAISRRLQTPIGAVVAIGILVRLLFWIIFPPIWKLYAAFTPLELGVLTYVADFQSYHPLRMPFFDIASLAVFLPLQGILGTDALIVFSVVVSCLGLVGFASGMYRLFPSRVALGATIAFAFYPKLIVMASRGIPEASAVAFLGLMFAPLSRLLVDTNRRSRLRSPAAAGVFALLSWLMFMPAVLAAIVTTLFLYSRDGRADRPSDRFGGVSLPSPSTALFALPSFLVGVLYLLIGPLSTAVSAASGSAIGFGERQLFIHSTGLAGRLGRYVGYTVLDFWWHQRGFDAEANILNRMSLVAEFLGPMFTPAAVVWAVTVLILTGVMVIGAISLVRNRRPESAWLLGWVLVYAILYNAKNIGWTGAFMTRQVAPVIPALCIVFGVGLVWVEQWVPWERLRGVSAGHSIEPYAVPVAVCLGCALLLVVGGIHGMATAGDAAETRQEIDALNQAVPVEADLIVVDSYTYYRTVLYSNGDLRPRIVLTEAEADRTTRYLTQAANVTVVDKYGDDGGFDAEYIYLLAKCDQFNSAKKNLINQRTVVYEHHSRSTGCDTRAVLLQKAGE